MGVGVSDVMGWNAAAVVCVPVGPGPNQITQQKGAHLLFLQTPNQIKIKPKKKDLIEAGDAEEAARAVAAAVAAPPTPTGAEGQEKEEEGPWEKGIELDAPDARGLRPIHHAARRGLTVRWWRWGSFFLGGVLGCFVPPFLAWLDLR